MTRPIFATSSDRSAREASYDSMLRSLCRAVLRVEPGIHPAPQWIEGVDEWFLEHAGLTWQSGIPAGHDADKALELALHGVGLDQVDPAHEAFWSSLDDAHRPQAKWLCDTHGGGDFDETSLADLGTYLALSRIIPLNRVIYDVGCAYGFQAWFFRHHRAYVGIADGPALDQRFSTPNSRHVLGRISEFTEPVDPCHFAIHNYCPGGRGDVVRIFRHVYSFYPEVDDHPELQRQLLSRRPA